MTRRRKTALSTSAGPGRGGGTGCRSFPPEDRTDADGVADVLREPGAGVAVAYGGDGDGAAGAEGCDTKINSR